MEDFEEYYDEDLEQPCEECGRTDMDDEWCPLCCPNGGWYSPGTEDCDFCPYDSKCVALQKNR